jgi:hypothetical protein
MASVGSGKSGRFGETTRTPIDTNRARCDDDGMRQLVGTVVRKLVVGVVLLLLLLGCAEDSAPQQPPVPSNVLVAERLFQAIASDASSYDLFFGAFMLSDSIFAGREDQLRCFTRALTEELERAGPASTLERLITWAKPSSMMDRDSLVVALNDSNLEERLGVGSAANSAIERCGGLLEAVLESAEGPSYTSCLIEAADQASNRDLFVAASIEMNGNQRAEFTPETTGRLGQYEMQELGACVERIEDARAEWAATSTTEALPGAECGQPGNGYGYIKVDQEWYTSARSVNTDPETSYHARVWGERETWFTGDGTVRNHQVTNGPGFDSFDDADAWLGMGAREPLETGILTHDQPIDAIGVLVDLPCLASLNEAEAQAAFDLLVPRENAFSAVLDELRHRGGIPADALRFAVQLLEDLPGVTREDRAVDSLGRNTFRLWVTEEGPGGVTERHEALFETSTNRLLEYLRIAVDEPAWTTRKGPFAIRRETVLAEGQVDSTQDRPHGVDSIDDPHRAIADMPEDQLFRTLPADLTCAELIRTGATYSEAVAYWVLHEKPSLIDRDLDAMPCDDDYDKLSVTAFWPEPPS